MTVISAGLSQIYRALRVIPVLALGREYRHHFVSDVEILAKGTTFRQQRESKMVCLVGVDRSSRDEVRIPLFFGVTTHKSWTEVKPSRRIDIPIFRFAWAPVVTSALLGTYSLRARRAQVHYSPSSYSLASSIGVEFVHLQIPVPRYSVSGDLLLGSSSNICTETLDNV